MTSTRTSSGACGTGTGKSWYTGGVPNEVTTAARMLILPGTRRGKSAKMSGITN